jgi:hypothetical protein
MQVKACPAKARYLSCCGLVTVAVPIRLQESAMSCGSQLSSGSLSEGKKARRRKSSVPVKAE